MNRKLYVIIFAAILNGIILCAAPRFGWVLSSGSADAFMYQGSGNVDNKTVAVYKMSGGTIEIGYGSRISRNLEIRLNKDERYTVSVGIDGGIKGEEPFPPDSVLNYALSDIIWKDSSGLFFYRYILAAITLFGCVFFIAKSKHALKSFYSFSAAVLFVVSVLISSRVMI